MAVFLTIGFVGLAVLIAAFIFDGIIESAMPELDGLPAISLPAVAGFVAAFGFAGALGTAAGWSALASSGAGAVAGLAVGAAAGAAMRVMQRSESAPSAVSETTVGTTGVVISAIPQTGYGQVRLRLGGHITTMNATSDHPIAGGTEVVVVAALSPTSIRVATAAGTDRQPNS